GRQRRAAPTVWPPPNSEAPPPQPQASLDALTSLLRPSGADATATSLPSPGGAAEGMTSEGSLRQRQPFRLGRNPSGHRVRPSYSAPVRFAPLRSAPRR